jgi:hypothetical protein
MLQSVREESRSQLLSVYIYVVALYIIHRTRVPHLVCITSRGTYFWSATMHSAHVAMYSGLKHTCNKS